MISLSAIRRIKRQLKKDMQGKFFALTDPIRAPIAQWVQYSKKTNELKPDRLIIRHFGIESQLDGLADLAKAGFNLSVSVARKGQKRRKNIAHHWPQYSRPQQSGRFGLRQNDSTSAHNLSGLAQAKRRAISYVLVSPIFNSDSPSAQGKRPIGPLKLAKLARQFPSLKLLALGGVHQRNLAQLRRCGLYGIAAVSLAPPTQSIRIQ